MSMSTSMTVELKTLGLAATATTAANVATWQLSDIHQFASITLAIVSTVWVVFQLVKAVWIWYIEIKTNSPRVTRRKPRT